MSGEKTVWVSRDAHWGLVDLWTHEPVRCEEDKTFYSLGGLTGICVLKVEHVKVLFDLTVRPGECLKIRLTVEVLEGEDGNGN